MCQEDSFGQPVPDGDGRADRKEYGGRIRRCFFQEIPVSYPVHLQELGRARPEAFGGGGERTRDRTIRPLPAGKKHPMFLPQMICPATGRKFDSIVSEK